MIEIRKGQALTQLVRAKFSARFRASFIDLAFRVEDQSIARLEEIAWQAYTGGRKVSFTQKAGPEYANPDYDLSSEWIATKQRIDEAQLRWADLLTPVPGVADLRLGAQRRHLPRRDVQDLPAVGDRSRNAGAGRHLI